MFHFRKRHQETFKWLMLLTVIGVIIIIGPKRPPFKENLMSLKKFWTAINNSESYTMEFLDESIKSSIAVLADVGVCRKKKPTYLVIIISRVASFIIRDTIRETWANPSNSYALRDGEVVIFFLVGVLPSRAILMEILEEGKKHNDLIVTAVPDVYNRLPLKVYAGMYFKQTHCPDVEYYVKVDDDVVLDLDRLIQQSPRAFPFSNHIYGAIRYDDFVIRRGSDKYYVPYKCYPRDVYPPYAPGAMYIMPSKAFREIWRTVRFAVWIRLEDVFYTGIVAELAAINRTSVKFMFSALDAPRLPEQWTCDERGQPELVAASSFCHPEQIQKFYWKLREIKCSNNQLIVMS